MPAVTIYSDLEAQENKIVTTSTFPHLFALKCWDWMPWS